MFRLRRDNFRKEYKEKHPDVKWVSVVSIPHPSLSLCSFELVVLRDEFPCELCVLIWFRLVELQIGKADGEKWKSLSDAVPWKMPSHVEATTLFQGLPLHLPILISRLSP